MPTVNVTMTVGTVTHYWFQPIAVESTSGAGVSGALAVAGWISQNSDGSYSPMSAALDPALTWHVRITFLNAPPVTFDGFAPGSGGDLLTLLAAQGWSP